MLALKPFRGTQLNKSHPLARGLVGCWLFNEGTGGKVFDLSGNGNAGILVADTHFVPGKYGSALSFDGNGDYVDYPVFDSGPSITVLAWILGSSWPVDVGIISHMKTMMEIDLSGTVFKWFPNTSTTSESTSYSFAPDKFYCVAVTQDASNNYALYVNGVSIKNGSTVGLGRTLTNHYIGTWIPTLWPHNGLINHAMIFSRALSSFEIALLYSEPFCMFERETCSIKFRIPNYKHLDGTAAGTSDVAALLNSIRSLPVIERSWLREALFNGMTANAFKLGTTLSLGWFWVRVAGCSALYRGSSMDEIDFANILAVSEQDEYGGGETSPAGWQVSPPSYIPHDGGSTYFYVVRRFNNCGYQERTLAAAVKVSISFSGDLAEPQPNNISSSKAKQIDSNKIQLVWFYCPLAQKSQPVSFNVYYDDRTGQIDFLQTPLATIAYKGRKFYSFQSSALEAGEYLFAIRAEDAGGIKNSSLARLRIQLDTASPDAVDILSAEGV